jgi:hypothetical protein
MRDDRRIAKEGLMSRIRSVRFFETAVDSVKNVVGQGAEHYDRARHLRRFASVWPGEGADDSPQSRRALRLRLARALRRERSLGQAGHWSYDLNRHIALLQAFRAETQEAPRREDA